GHRRYDPLDHLKKLDLKENLALCHPKYETCFFLAARHSLYPSPVNLGEIAGIVENKSCTGSNKPPAFPASPNIISQQSRHKIYDQKLDHQGCSPDDPYNNLCQIT